jgi:GDP-L-fucose synthase
MVCGREDRRRKLCDAYRRQHGCDFISAMPTNLYGPNDNFD